jgi:siroheme synthase-like protein
VGYYAAFLDVGGKPCVVIGGDHLAADKARGLHQAGAEVRMVWPQFGVEAEELGAAGRATLHPREFEETDLDGCFLAIDASGDDERGPAWAAAADERRVLLNVLDRPARCDFIAPRAGAARAPADRDLNRRAQSLHGVPPAPPPGSGVRRGMGPAGGAGR